PLHVAREPEQVVSGARKHGAMRSSACCLLPPPLAGDGRGGGFAASHALVAGPPPGSLRDPTSPASGRSEESFVPASPSLIQHPSILCSPALTRIDHQRAL